MQPGQLVGVAAGVHPAVADARPPAAAPRSPWPPIRIGIGSVGHRAHLHRLELS